MQVIVEQISNGYLVTQPPAGSKVAQAGNPNAIKSSCATLSDVLNLLGTLMPPAPASTAASTP